MPRYSFTRNESGTTSLVQQDATIDFEPPEPPPLPEVDDSTITVHRCTACGKDFPIIALVAKHFKRAHEDMYENKDSWRANTTEVIVG